MTDQESDHWYIQSFPPRQYRGFQNVSPHSDHFAGRLEKIKTSSQCPGRVCIFLPLSYFLFYSLKFHLQTLPSRTGWGSYRLNTPPPPYSPANTCYDTAMTIHCSWFKLCLNCTRHDPHTHTHTQYIRKRSKRIFQIHVSVWLWPNMVTS